MSLHKQPSFLSNLLIRGPDSTLFVHAFQVAKKLPLKTMLTPTNVLHVADLC